LTVRTTLIANKRYFSMKRIRHVWSLAALVAGGLLLNGVTSARADSIRPSVTILTPTTGNSDIIGEVNIRATDNVSISRVSVLVYRRDDGQFLGPAGFGPTATFLPTARGVGGDPDVYGLIQFIGPQEGRFTIYAFAFDNDGTSATARCFVDNNLRVPTIALQTSFNVTAIQGTANDGANGSGIGDIRLVIQRPDSQYWNGTAFQPAVFYLPTTMNPPGGGTDNIEWVLNANLPSFADITQEGRYTVSALAFDRAGRVGRDVRTGFLNRRTPTTQFSAGNASAATQTINLVFTGPLDPASVTPQAFGVVVGVGLNLVPVTNATYNAANNTVTLTVMAGSFTAFSPVAAGWQGLRDAQGRPFTDYSGVLLAGP